MTSPPATLSSLAWTPAEAALVLAPLADAEALEWLAARLLAEVEPGRYRAADLLGIHHALSPWLRAAAAVPA